MVAQPELHHRVPLQCIVPPHILEHLATSGHPQLAPLARETLARSAETRGRRESLWFPDSERETHPGGPGKHRLIYDARGSFDLPGRLVRAEGDAETGDTAVREAYRHTGSVWDFFHKCFDRNSLDNRGLSLVSCVHVGRSYSNAFWDGERMAFGDGDGILFRRFTRSIEVIAHELTHGLISFTSNLRYYGEPGALNEHLGDVFGVLARQWKRKLDVTEADWTIGGDLLVKASTRRALRDLAAPGNAYRDDPFLGNDPQPAHWDNRYRGDADNGGVHINSGIPNHAFYRAAIELGGRAWEQLGLTWYHALQTLHPDSRFIDCAEVTESRAAHLFGARSREVRCLRRGWKAVGIIA